MRGKYNKKIVSAQFQLCPPISGTVRPEPEPPPQLSYNWWYNIQFVVDLSVLMTPISQDDAHSTTILCPLNHQITHGGGDDWKRNSLYLHVKNLQIWYNLKVGFILDKNNYDYLCN